MELTANELVMLSEALKSVTFIDGMAKSPEQIRLERKLSRWSEHENLIFVEGKDNGATICQA